MSSESEFLIETWEAVRDVLPASKRSDAASAIMTAFMEYGFEAKELAPASEEDPDLQQAFKDVFAEEDEDDDYIDEE